MNSETNCLCETVSAIPRNPKQGLNLSSGQSSTKVHNTLLMAEL